MLRIQNQYSKCTDSRKDQEVAEAEMTREEAEKIVKEEEAKRIKKNLALKEWRVKNKEKYAKYMKDWKAERKQKIEAAKQMLKSA